MTPECDLSFRASRLYAFNPLQIDLISSYDEVFLAVESISRIKIILITH